MKEMGLYLQQLLWLQHEKFCSTVKSTEHALGTILFILYEFCSENRDYCKKQADSYDIKEKKKNFSEQMEDIPAELIMNWDQTGSLSNWTMEKQGARLQCWSDVTFPDPSVSSVTCTSHNEPT